MESGVFRVFDRTIASEVDSRAVVAGTARTYVARCGSQVSVRWGTQTGASFRASKGFGTELDVHACLRVPASLYTEAVLSWNVLSSRQAQT